MLHNLMTSQSHDRHSGRSSSSNRSDTITSSKHTVKAPDEHVRLDATVCNSETGASSVGSLCVRLDHLRFLQNGITYCVTVNVAVALSPTVVHIKLS